MFKPIPKSNITIRPFKVHKTFTLDSGSLPFNVVRNLTGSSDVYDSYVISGSTGYRYNEYSFNKGIRALYYNVSRKIGSVINWDYVKHKSNTQYLYEVTSSNGYTEYRNYFDYTSQIQVNEFLNFLNSNSYTVNADGQILYGTAANPLTLYGKMNVIGSVTERLIGNRYFVIQFPQIYFGETIRPGSVSIYDNTTGQTFVDDEFGNLLLSTDETIIVGNIFYSHGIATITYQTDSIGQTNYNFGNGNYSITFQSTKTIFENEIFIEVAPTEFNISTNPSALVDYNGVKYVKSLITLDASGSATTDRVYDFRISSSHTFNYPTIYGPSGSSKTNSIGFNDYEYSSSVDPTGSYLAPYITTIGLYDGEYNLVAVAKIPSKPKSTPDYPINFVVRFDT